MPRRLGGDAALCGEQASESELVGSERGARRAYDALADPVEKSSGIELGYRILDANAVAQLADELFDRPRPVLDDQTRGRRACRWCSWFLLRLEAPGGLLWQWRRAAGVGSVACVPGVSALGATASGGCSHRGRQLVWSQRILELGSDVKSLGRETCPQTRLPPTKWLLPRPHLVAHCANCAEVRA